MVEGWAPRATEAGARRRAQARRPPARADAAGRPVWSRLPDGTEHRARYHAGGALATIELTTPDGALVSTPIVDELARDAHGRIASARLGDACVVTWAYDRDTGRLVAQDARRGARWYQGLRYTYDADGRVTLVEARSSGGLITHLTHMSRTRCSIESRSAS